MEWNSKHNKLHCYTTVCLSVIQNECNARGFQEDETKIGYFNAKLNQHGIGFNAFLNSNINIDKMDNPEQRIFHSVQMGVNK